MERRRFIWGIAYSLWARVLSIVAEKRAGTSSTLFSNSYSLIPIPYFLLAALVLGLWLEGLSGPVYAFQSPPPLLSFAKSVSRTEAEVGDILTYTLTITNNGGYKEQLAVIDSLPPYIRWNGYEHLTASPGITPGYDAHPTRRRVGWTGPVMAGPTVITISWQGVISALPPSKVIVNEMLVYDWDPQRLITRTATTAVDLPLRVKFEQQAKPAQLYWAWVGEPITYTLIVTNGNRPLGLTTLSNTLPEGAVWDGGLAASPGIRPTYNPINRRVEGVGEVLTGPTVITLAWRVTVPSLPPSGEVVNQARLQARQVDLTRVTTMAIRLPPQITATKLANPTIVAPGEPFTYTVLITNTGGLGYYLDILDYLPSEVTWRGNLTATPGSGLFYDPNQHMVFWGGPVISGPSVTAISWQVSADAAQPGDTIVNQVIFRNFDEPRYFTRTAAVTVVGGGSQQRQHLYLPLILKEATASPDLVVTRLEAAGDKVAVVIKNVGDRPVTDAFWVDVYLDPDSAPTRVNQRWQDVGSQGLVWGVKGAALPIDPGETLRLTIGDAYYFPKRSRFSPPLAEGAKVYAQVDSISLLTTYGGVLESHEIVDGAYNNIIEIVAPRAAGDQHGAATLVSEKPPPPTSDDLPPRRSLTEREEGKSQ